MAGEDINIFAFNFSHVPMINLSRSNINNILML